MTTRNHTSVIVVGAGYAGLMTANRLAGRGHEVTVVSDRPDFVDRIRLHELVAGSRPRVTTPLHRALHRRCTLVQARATAIHDGSVALSDGRTLTAPHVVLAVGSSGGEAAWSLESAQQLRDDLRALPAGAGVRVDGAGPTGIETATEIATRRPDLRVTLADPAGVAPYTGPDHATWLDARLRALGVTPTTAAAPADLVIPCTGLRPPTLAADSGLPVDPAGRVQLDDTLQVIGHPGVWAAGDAGTVVGGPLRMGCAVAEPMGAHVADAIHAVSRGTAAPAFDYGFLFQCVSLGRKDGIITFVHRDDSPTSRRLTGRPGAWAKEAICRIAAVAPIRAARSYAWAGSGR